MLLLPPCAPCLQDPAPVSMEAVAAELAGKGVRFDPERGLIELDGRIAQTYEPLEYLLVARPKGKDYEALLAVEDVSVGALNTALLLAGMEPGRNAKFALVQPPPTPEEMAQGAPAYTVEPPAGTGMYIYVWWEEEVRDAAGARSERYFYRAEDLVLNARSERTYQRGPWIYLGSRFVRPHKDAPELFAAEAEGNLVSIVYFDPSNQLMTGSDPEADNQHVWYPNFYLLPEIGHPVKILFSREPLDAPPPTLNAPASAEGGR
ncbi:MAG: hypothetical protein EYC70_02140 [Planctomycetota bacterium]|nr:MAG: hypothetical protein EYC70_02140 [Planctomycetota bacterium]